MNPARSHYLAGISLEDLYKKANTEVINDIQAEFLKNLYKERLKNKEDGKS